jgi:hypothetical protein
MNLSPDGVTVRFKTAPEERFLAEKSGAKPNTVRIIDAYEADLIRHTPPTRIIIQNQQEVFIRTLTDIHLNYGILGKVLAIFSWIHEEHHHSMSEHDLDQEAHIHSMPYEPGNYDLHAEEGNSKEEPSIDPTRSLEEQGSLRYEQTIKISTSLRKKLDSYRFTKMYDTFISELLANYIPSADKQQSIDERFVAITISRGTLSLIQSIAHGRTMNKVIQELYEAYVFQISQERGPLHD